MGPYPSKIDQRDRTRSLKVRHPTESSEKVRYGASLYIKSKSRRRKKFLLQKVSENGIAHIAGLRDEDEIISINQRQLDKNDTVESIVNDIESSDYILLELKRKMTGKKEPIPFIVFFNLTVEACGEVTIHQFGFYWRTPLNEWKEILNPLIQRVIAGGGRGECIQSLPVIKGREFVQASTPRTSWTLFGTPKRVQISFDDDYLTIAGRSLILAKGGMGTNSHFWQYVYSPSSSLLTRNPEVPVIFVPVNLDNFRIVSIGPQVALGKFDLSETITEAEQLFFLSQPISDGFIIRYDGARGTLYWNCRKQVVALTTRATCFQITNIDN